MVVNDLRGRSRPIDPQDPRRNLGHGNHDLGRKVKRQVRPDIAVRVGGDEVFQLLSPRSGCWLPAFAQLAAESDCAPDEEARALDAGSLTLRLRRRVALAADGVDQIAHRPVGQCSGYFGDGDDAHQPVPVTERLRLDLAQRTLSQYKLINCYLLVIEPGRQVISWEAMQRRVGG